MQVKAEEVRDKNLYRGDFYDTIIWQFDSTGRHINAVQISNRDQKIDMYLGSNCLTKVNNKYFFGGWSAGFYTSQQTKKYAPSLTNYDAFVYAY